MKLSLRLPNGATLEFEGDSSEFEQIQGFLENPPESLAADVAPEEEITSGDEGEVEDGNGEALLPPASELSPAALEARFTQVGPKNDQERVTIIAQMAVESGKEGIDYDTLIALYRELGLRTPAQFPAKTFANAKASGLAVPIKPGLWRPTYRGANFGRGFGRSERQARRVLPRQITLSDSEGGEPD